MVAGNLHISKERFLAGKVRCIFSLIFGRNLSVYLCVDYLGKLAKLLKDIRKRGFD
jgi:hypothetical protein